MNKCALMAVLGAAWQTVGLAQIPAINWEQQKAEILRHHRALVQIDTSNPPGNETKAAEYLKGYSTLKVFPRNFSLWTPARANIVAA